tara:strand:+ start:2132 stop:3604 length:1473 start_codon:yes stop_codon:yes gene_type:complete
MFSFVLALLGLVNAIYLTVQKLFQVDYCVIGNSCQSVINSSYGMIGGLPLSIYGILFFFIIAYISYQRAFNSQSSLGFELLLLSIGGVFSIHLMIIQFFVIKSFCIYCSFSATVTIVLLVLSALRFNDENDGVSLTDFLPSRYIFTGVSVIFVFLVSLIVYSKILSNTYDIEILEKKAATSTIKDFSTTDLNNLAGIEYTKALMQIQSIRKQAFLDSIARYDAALLGLQLDQYFMAFVQNNLLMNDQNTRNAIKSLKGNPSAFQQYLDNIDDIEQKDFRNRFLDLQKDLLAYYNARFLLDTTYQTQVKDNSYGAIQIGNPKAPLKLIVFSDFLCSHCASFHATMEHLFKRYPEFFHITYRSFPIQGKISELLALYGICSANQNKYLDYADSIYENQSNITYQTIQSFIPESINKQQLQVCINDRTANNLLQDDIKEVKRLNIQATPTVFLNGYLSNIASIKTELSKLLKTDVRLFNNHSGHSHDHSGHSH